MTGYAARDGEGAGLAWSWELRGVNAKGLDIRLRLPDRMGALEAALRDRIATRAARGSINLTLRVMRAAGAAAQTVDDAALGAALAAVIHVGRMAEAKGLPMAPLRATDLLAMPGVHDARGVEPAAPDTEVLLEDFDAVLTDFAAMRAAEGRALLSVLTRQLDDMAALIEEAAGRAATRQGAAADSFAANVARVLEATDKVDPARLAQELAILAVKGDVTEEIDRLRAHVAAARDLLAAKTPVGRKLDFLMQEFNREANTLCSKSADTALTRAGLDLKVLIDQMREQVQNVE